MTRDPHPSRPLVAAIIPCFNLSKYIGEAVASVLCQTYDNIEIVVVNDGSTDDFDNAIAPFRDRVHVISQVNAGEGAARNRGVAATNADFVAFLDADDRWRPDKTAKQAALLDSRPDCGLVHSARTLIDADGRVIDASPLAPEPSHDARGHCLLPLVGGNPIIASSVMLRRRLLENELFITDRLGGADWDMWLRLAPRTRFERVDEPLTDYRVHPTNFSRHRGSMARGTVRIMDGVLARESGGAVRAAAAAQRHEAILEVAHLEYEAGNYPEARRWFRKAGPRLQMADIIRYGGTFMPPRIHATAQRAWRAMRGRRRS